MNQRATGPYQRRILQTGAGRVADLAAVVDLALHAPKDEVSAVALPYQLSSWALDDAENLSLWTDRDGQLVAFALHQVPFATLYYAVHPAAERTLVEREIFVWGQARAQAIAASGDGTYTFSVWPAERMESTQTTVLETGYQALDAGKVFFERQLDNNLAVPTLPPGFVIRPLLGESEVRAATDLLQTAFGITTVTEAWRRRILQQPQYRTELDVVVEAPAGQLAAFCLFWLHPGGGLGQIEPMATHPAFQRRGLGKALIIEGFRRLSDLAVDHVLVGTSSTNTRSQSLYQSVGFQVHHRHVGFQFTAHSE